LEYNMSLPAAQQRVLDGIADGLRRTEPKLAAMYAMFTRLCGSEAPPSRERLERRRAWCRWAGFVARLRGGLTSRRRGTWRLVLIASQAAVAVVILSVLASMGGRAATGCGQVGKHRPVAQARPWCPSQPTAYALPGK
jgi:hypothetical protein